MNFLETLLHYTRQSESPHSYFLWSGLTAVAAVCRDNVYHVFNYSKTYPNIYVLLLGPPALGKKTPMMITGKMIRAVGNTKIISGSASMQAVIKTLGTYETGGQRGASCILYSEELSSFYIKDQSTGDLLTDLWDYHEKWERNLISWNATLNNVCITLLAASNEVLIKDILDARATYGGLLSRTIVVMEKKKSRKDAMIRKEQTIIDDSDVAVLINHLKNVSKLKGELSFDNDASKEFEEWYALWDEDNPRTKTGIEGRMKTHVKKISMLLALCEENLDLVIRRNHVEYAIELCLGLYRNYQILSMEAGTSPTAPHAAILLRLLYNSTNNTLSRTMILRRNLGEFNATLLEETVTTMAQAGLIIEVQESNTIYYKLTKAALELYEETKKEKRK